MWAYFFAKGHSVPVIFLYHDVEERYGIFIRFLVELIDQEIFYHVVSQGASYGNGVLAVATMKVFKHLLTKIRGLIKRNKSDFDRPAVSMPDLSEKNDKTEERKRRASDSYTTIKSGHASYHNRSSRLANRDETPLVREPAYEDAKGLRESLMSTTPDILHENAIMNRKDTFGSLGTELDSEIE